MPINNSLYAALVNAFQNVKIAKEGQSMVYRIITNPITQQRQASIQTDCRGEEYRICCPFCGDTRHRLWINHKWQTRDEANGITFGNLLNCFNDGCPLNKDSGEDSKRRDCVDDLKKLISPLMRHTVNIHVERVDVKETIPALPKDVVSIGQLGVAHHAISYLRARGFNLDLLIQDWQVMYCANDLHPFVDNRIIIPVYYGGKLVGWQARYIGKPSDNVPKYFTMPGMRKSAIIYNFDRAKHYRFGVLVEGATDVWSVGFQGIATFGAELHTHQLACISAAWRDTGVVLLADGDVTDTDEKAARYERLKSRLNSCNFPCGVLEVRLPSGTDPGFYRSNDLWALIIKRAYDTGYHFQIFSEDAFKGACHL